MKKNFLLSVLIFTISVCTAQQKEISEHLKPFAPFVGKTWVGEFTDPSGKEMRDVSKWKRILNGNAIRILHSLNKGMYGGETVLYYDKVKKAVSFHYFTTAGFQTSGTFEFKNDEFIGMENVTGSEDGITLVKSVSKFIDKNSFEVKSQYLQKGEWIKGHNIKYKLDNSAKVIFK